MTDCHIHLSFADLISATKYLEESKSLGVHRHILAGYDSSDWKTQIQLKSMHPESIRTCIGIHPWVLRQISKAEFETQFKLLENLASQTDLIGETGLDGFRPKDNDQDLLEELSFRNHLDLAVNLDKPLVLHLVKEPARSLDILRSYKRKFRGIIHGFSGSKHIALQYVDLGFLISIGPGVLSAKFKNLTETARTLPLAHIVCETDQPDSPNQKTDPTLLNKVLSQLYNLRPESPAQIDFQIEKNVDSLFIGQLVV